MTTRRWCLVGGAALLLPLLAACDRKPSKAELLKKAENVRTRGELEKALGQPDEVDKTGPVQRWTYKASDGSVTYIMLADRVVLDVTGNKPK